MNNINNGHLCMCISGVNFAWYLIILGGHDCHQLDKSGRITLPGSGHTVFQLSSSNIISLVPSSLYASFYLGL